MSRRNRSKKTVIPPYVADESCFFARQLDELMRDTHPIHGNFKYCPKGRKTFPIF